VADPIFIFHYPPTLKGVVDTG